MNRLLRCLLLVAVSVDQTALAAFAPSHHSSSHQSASSSSSVQKRNVQLAMDVSTADVILPSLIFLAGVAGSIVYSDESLKEKVLKIRSSSSEEGEDDPEPTTTTAVVAAVSEPEPEPEVVVVAPPPPTPVVAVVKPVAPATPSKSISDLRKEVASTVADVRATQALIQQRTVESNPAPEPEPEPEPEAPKKKRGILRQSLRFLKKVVAPWRKWENIR